MRNNFLSIIIPLYNEEKRIMKLSEINKFLFDQKFESEVLLVNDGSTDNTPLTAKEIVQKFPNKNIFKIISYPNNKGKGFAIRMGMLEANGQYRLFTDIDLSTPLEEFNKFKPFLKKFDIVIGSRKRKGARLIKRQPELREKLGKGFTKLSQLALGLNLTDFTCGFKCFSIEAAEEIFKRQRIERWGFDSEDLFIANKLGFSIKEVPVTWENDSETKVRLPKDIINSFSDLIKIRINNIKGLYS